MQFEGPSTFIFMSLQSNPFHAESTTSQSPSEDEQQCFETNNPTPCRVQSPQERNEPHPTKRMKEHNVIESLLKSSNSPPTLSPSLSRPPSTMKKTSRDQSDSSQRSKPNNSKTKQFSQQKPNHSSAASLVVCGVDGTVFTLDAYTGQLRGMFASGPALVYSSDAVREQSEQGASNPDVSTDDYDNLEDLPSSVIAAAPRPWKERVVPGLDGRLYSLYEQNNQDIYDDEDSNPSECQLGADHDDFIDELCNSEDNLNAESSTDITQQMDQYNLQPLPISVMDVVDSPISTCRPVMDFSEAFEGIQRQQCGIVVGSKKTTIYAIDPLTGKVRWTQDPHGGGGAKGFTTGRPADARGKPTVLLQREDYAVRHLDTDGGDEVWKVELGRFSALDFDIDAHRHNHDEDEMDDPVVVGGRGRGAAAAAAATKEKQKAKMPPILGGGSKHKFGSFKDEPDFEDNEFEFKYEHSNFRAFPSIAFGEVRFVL